MAIPSFSMRQLLEAGVHFGHHTRRWNPRMEPFIFGQRNNIHILDLQQTVPMLGQALEAMRNTVLKGGRVLFVGTKRVAADADTRLQTRQTKHANARTTETRTWENSGERRTPSIVSPAGICAANSSRKL